MLASIRKKAQWTQVRAQLTILTQKKRLTKLDNPLKFLIRIPGDRKLLFEPVETLTQESGRCQPFFLFLIRD